MMLAVLMVFYVILGRNFTNLDASAHLEGEASPVRFKPIFKLLAKTLLAVTIFAAILPTLIVFFAASRYGYGGDWFDVGQNLGSNYSGLLEAVPNFWRNI